jgi:hypothetical protein
MRTPSFSSLLAAAMLAGLSACGGDATAPDGLLVEATETELVEGQTTALVASLDGESVGDADVQWISRDPSTVAVTGETARGVAPGAAWIVAQVGPLRDSVRVVVRFPALAANTVAARVAAVNGEGEHRFTLEGAALQFERTSPVWSHIHAVAGRPENALPDDIFAGDTIVSIHFPGGLAMGSKALPPLDVVFTDNIGFLGDAGVFVAIEEEEDGSSRAYYVAVEEATLEITSLTLPDESGRGTGSVSGRMSFQAAGVRVRVPTPPAPLVLEPIGDQTFPVYVEFTTLLYRVPLSSGELTIAGTPYAGSIPAGGDGEMTEAGLQATVATLIDRDAEVPTYVETTLTLPAPAIGTFDLADADAARLAVFFAPFIETPPGSGGGTLGDRTNAVASAGTVTVTSYRAPTETVYGEITATVQATLDFGAEHPDHAATVEWTFRIPIDPLEGSVVR